MAVHLCQRRDIARRDDAGGNELLKTAGNKLAKRVGVALCGGGGQGEALLLEAK